MNNRMLQEKIKLRLDCVENNDEKRQLKFILSELKMAEKSFGLNLCYPRLIIDSWGYTDQLGIELINLHKAYQKIC